jgi:hypothetical protein
MTIATISTVHDFRRRALLRTIAASGSSDLATECAKHPGIWEVFDDEADLLQAARALAREDPTYLPAQR